MYQRPGSLASLQDIIGYSFSDLSLLQRAVTHPSYCKTGSNENTHNQRLEFLGDAVLGMILAEDLYQQLPDEREGVLTRHRSVLVRGRQLSELAREINLGHYLLVGDAEDQAGIRDLPSLLEDAFEALLGAVYLDGGLPAARQVARKLYGDLRQRLQSQLDGMNPKGTLQERLQPVMGNNSIEYRLASEQGPDHNKEFTVEVWIDKECRGSGTGPSKKRAEEAAARKALQQLDTVPASDTAQSNPSPS